MWTLATNDPAWLPALRPESWLCPPGNAPHAIGLNLLPDRHLEISWLDAGCQQGLKCERVIDDSAFGVRARIKQSFRIDPKSKPVYAQVYESEEIASLNYWLELLAGIATLGLVLDSPAVVIGAMLISPLVGPILAAGLALAAGDFYLGVKSVVNVRVGR